ncbi:hypothetical protein D9M73_126490 [compost metagenome]
MAILVAARVLGKLQIPGRTAIGVEHFVAVELAIAVDGGEADPGGQFRRQREVGVIDVALQAELGATQHLRAIGRARQFGIAIVAAIAARRRLRARAEGRAGVALAVIGQHQRGGERIGRCPAQRTAQAALILAVEIVLLGLALILVGHIGIAGDVADEAVMIFVGEGEARRERVVADIDEARHLPAIVIAVGCDDPGGRSGLGPGRDDVHRANCGCGAEQRRLRPLHDFNALKIEQILICATRARDVDAVIVQRNARALLRRAAIRGDATDHEARVVVALLLNAQTGNVHRHFGERVDPQRLHLCAGQRRHRDRHVLQLLFTLLRGDDDVAALRLGRLCCGGRLGERRRRRATEEDARKSEREGTTHR